MNLSKQPRVHRKTRTVIKTTFVIRDFQFFYFGVSCTSIFNTWTVEITSCPNGCLLSVRYSILPLPLTTTNQHYQSVVLLFFMKIVRFVFFSESHFTLE